MAAVVRYVCDDERGEPLFDIRLDIPDRQPNDMLATERMRAAVTDVFGDLGELSASQAHAILAARDYGRECARQLLDRSPAGMLRLFGSLIAAYVLADEDRLADVVAWSDRRFERQTEGSSISRSKRFDDVAAWVEEVIEDARAAGATL